MTTSVLRPSPLPVAIEDEPAVMSYVRAALERSGYTVVCSESGVDGLRLLESGDFRAWSPICALPAEWMAGCPCLGGRDTGRSWRPAWSLLPATLPTKKPWHAAEDRRTLRGKTFSGEAIYFGRGENHRGKHM